MPFNPKIIHVTNACVLRLDRIAIAMELQLHNAHPDEAPNASEKQQLPRKYHRNSEQFYLFVAC